MKRIAILGLILVLVVGLASCGGKRQKTGTAIGAGAGAAIGAVLGNRAGNTAVGAIIGAVVGGAAGAHIGNYMDQQAEELENELEGARIERVGEGILVTFESGLLFDVDQATLKPAAVTNLERFARVLAKYDDTNVLVEGHTDATGSENYNQMLSVRRAETVAGRLTQLDIDRSRLTINGYGETQPIADNDTEAGRAQNRRVDIAIFANDELREAAEKRAG